MSLLSNMCLPTRTVRFGSARGLFDGLAQVFEETLRLPTRDARLSAYFQLSTHFVDYLCTAPCLAVVAAEPSDAVQYLKVLGASCRHPLLLADLHAAGVSALPSGLYPTLLFSQSIFSSAAVRCMLASQHRGFGILERSGIVAPCCAKALVVDELTPQALSALACAQIYLPPDRNPAMADDAVITEIAAKFQPRLLDYRLINHAAVRSSKFDVLQFFTPTREIARAFGACIVNDADLQAGAIEVLQSQDESARGTRWTSLDSLVVESLVVLCHEKERSNISVGDVAEIANGILTARKDMVQLKPRKVGALLRALGVFSDRGGKGYSFVLLNDVRRQIHTLARVLDVPTLRENVENCEYCAEAMAGN